MADLFRNTPYNILPDGGEAVYYGVLFAPDEAARLFCKLRYDIPWKPDMVKMYGRLITTKRKVAWYGDKPYIYTYSGMAKTALPWNETLLEIKARVEDKTGHSFNSCFANLYHSGDEGMSWHTDNEPTMGRRPIIASVSLGAERKFAFKHRTNKRRIDLILENGSLLLMRGDTQINWLHSLPKSKRVRTARINLTFRNFIE